MAGRGMRIAFPVEDHRGLDDRIFEHFGHAPAFLLVDVDGEGRVTGVSTLDNTFQGHHGPGMVPALLARAGVNVLICRGLGRRAMEYFRQLGIEVIGGASGRVGEVLNLYLSGLLESRDYRPAERWGGCHEQEGCEGEGQGEDS